MAPAHELHINDIINEGLFKNLYNYTVCKIKYFEK